jgi:hypothetical protein
VARAAARTMRPRGICNGSGRDHHRLRLASSERPAGKRRSRRRRWCTLFFPEFILVGNGGHRGIVGRICVRIHEYGRANRRCLDRLPHSLDRGTLWLDSFFSGGSWFMSLGRDQLACGGSSKNFVTNTNCRGARSGPHLRDRTKSLWLPKLPAALSARLDPASRPSWCRDIRSHWDGGAKSKPVPWD